MDYGLIAVRVYPDGREAKAITAVWESVFGIKDAVTTGDVYERDGVAWFTPGNGCATFTEDVRAKMLDAFKAEGVDAEDWTEIDLEALGVKRAGDVIAVKKDGKVRSSVFMAPK